MIRFALTSFVAFVIVCSLTTHVALAEQAKCSGTITKIDGEKVTVKDTSNQEHHMTVVPSTKVMVDGKAAKTTDLKTGQQVSCTCDKQGDKMTCSSIEARSNP
jgi:Cu/Ag efflux protein CusF